MNDHMTIGEILSGDSGDRPQAGEMDAPQAAGRSWQEPQEPVEAVVDDVSTPPSAARAQPDSRQARRTNRIKVPPAEASDRSDADAPADEQKPNADQPNEPNPQAAVLHHLERITMPSVALANRMADEFEIQIERANNELKYARQRANFAWSAVAFLGLAMLFLAWWTGGSIEGSRATAKAATETIETERQRVVALTNELFEMRRGAQEAQTAERTRSLDLIQKLEQANDTISQMVKRATDAERRLADASATIAMLEQQVDQMHDELQASQRPATAPSPVQQQQQQQQTQAPTPAAQRPRQMVPAGMPQALRDMVEVPATQP